MRVREATLLILALSSGCSGGTCRPEPVPTCDPKDGTCVGKPAEPKPPEVTAPPAPAPAPDVPATVVEPAKL